MDKYEFTRSTTGFQYTFEKSIPANTTILLKMPPVSANKRGVNDIGWVAESGVNLYATLSTYPLADTAIWQQLQPYDEVNKTTNYIKIENTADSAKRVNIRAILN